MELVHKALSGFGTNEMLLTELVLGRSGSEIRLLIEGYRIRYGKDLLSVVKSHLSGKNERSMCFFYFVVLDVKPMFFLWAVFIMALNGQRPPDHFPVDPLQVETDIETLHHASKKKEEVS